MMNGDVKISLSLNEGIFCIFYETCDVFKNIYKD
jgi:hypothetical protein